MQRRLLSLPFRSIRWCVQQSFNNPKTMMCVSLLLEFGRWPSKKMLGGFVRCANFMTHLQIEIRTTPGTANYEWEWSLGPFSYITTVTCNILQLKKITSRECLLSEKGINQELKYCIKEVFMFIYWLAKEESATTSFLSLLELIERAGLQNLEHFTYAGEGTFQQMFRVLGQVVKDRVVERVKKSKFFGCLCWWSDGHFCPSIV